MPALRRVMFPAILVLIGLAPRLAGAHPAADSSSYWLIPYVQYGWLDPSPPVPGAALMLHLHGTFPYDCGEIADTSVVATDIEFTMRPRAGACADTTRSWNAAFNVGPLSAGLHVITLRRTLVRVDGSIDVHGGEFEISVGQEPPPPPVACPLFSGFTTSPDSATTDEPTQVTLFGCFPYPCGQVNQSQILGPTHLEITMQQTSGCPDSVSTWSRTFDLGLLAAGDHNLRVTVRDVATPLVTQEFGTWFFVRGVVPPPPPPPPPPTGGPLFDGATTIPSPATTSAPTVIVARGFFAYPCGFVSNATVLSPSEVSLTVGPGFSCPPDTTRAWEQGFNLGLLAAGSHDVTFHIRDAGAADSLGTQTFSWSFDVVDDGPPPPPDPPIDSLLASVPNPFVEDTRFGLVLDRSAHVEVGVYDLQGRVVRSIFRGTIGAGTWNFTWDGHADDGTKVSAGVYFYRVIGPRRTISRRVVLMSRP